MTEKRIIDRRIMDLTGRRFGRLTAVNMTSARTRNGSVIWHCRCECGGEVNVSEDCLVQGKQKSCGCMRAEMWKHMQKFCHLIDGTSLEYLEKRKHRSDNKSGFRGVYLMKNGRFKVNIGFKRQRFYVGTYDTYAEAVTARMEVEDMIHGQFIKAYYAWDAMRKKDPQWEKSHPLIFEVSKVNGKFEIITNMIDVLSDKET